MDLNIHHLGARVSLHTPAWRMHAPQPFNGPQRLGASGQPHTASKQRSLRRRAVTISCNAASDDQTPAGAAGNGADAIELAEEGPSTDIAVIWSRLSKVGPANHDVSEPCRQSSLLAESILRCPHSALLHGQRSMSN